jgi:hypothetical protein
MKVKIRLMLDKVSNLFKKKKPVKPDFRHPLYAQRKAEPQKSMGGHAIAFLLPVVCECGVVVWGDLKWVMTRRKRCAVDVWAEAVERMQKDSQ